MRPVLHDKRRTYDTECSYQKRTYSQNKMKHHYSRQISDEIVERDSKILLNKRLPAATVFLVAIVRLHKPLS